MYLVNNYSPQLFLCLLDAFSEEISLLERRDDALSVDRVVDVETLDADGALTHAVDHVTQFGDGRKKSGAENA